MKVSNTEFNGRPGWRVDNGRIQVVVLQGGGHIASLTHGERPDVNPLWVPPWKPVEPWVFGPKDRSRYGLRLLGAIAGHNLCLGWFGDPSDEESRAGMECHGEASVVRWRLAGKRADARAVGLTCSCELPVAQMELTRTLTLDAGRDVVRVREELKSSAKRDMPFTMCQHVTFGPPFLEKGETVFDMPATKGHTFPGTFSDRQRLAGNRAFAWPNGPGSDGCMVDLRRMESKRKASSDFSSQLIDVNRETAWFSSVNARMGLGVAYVWNRCDYPWVGNWEENGCRKSMPWAGRTFARGMEFANSPFPVGLRRAVDMGKFHGIPTYRWLTAQGSLAFEYEIIIRPVDPGVRGVADISRTGKGHAVAFLK